VDSFTPSENALGVLVILQSDDPAMLHRRIEITKSVTTLGRKADNDVIFAKDSPVSRHHAVIEERSGQLFLSEVLATDESGHTKPPAYGTFINGKRVEDSTPLRDGDKIQLGKRVQIQFEAVKPSAGEGEQTVDQLTTRDDEQTMDFGGTQA
jgi:pSer/pThr/pTyr-binding forkhead associated (FHA) protein